MHQSLLLSPQLHNSIRYDYHTISKKSYSWVPKKRKAALYTICVCFFATDILLVTYSPIQIDPGFTLTAPRRLEILPPPIQDKAWACLATRFNVQKTVVRSIIKLDKEVLQYGKVRQGNDLMTGCHFVKKSEDSRDASFVRVGLVFFLCLRLLTTLL